MSSKDIFFKLFSIIKEKKIFFFLLLIIISGFLVRTYGINFGKPYLYHIDEWKFVNQAGNLLDIKNLSIKNRLNLGIYPPFIIYILSVVYAIFGVMGLITGYFPSVASIIETYKSNPFTLHLIGRNISTMMGSATIYFT